MASCERSVLFSDAENIRPRVENPRLLRRATLLEENDVCFNALTIGGESSARQTQYRMQSAVLHDDLEYFTCLVLQETVVRQQNRSSATGFQDVYYMLNKIELLVAGFNGE